jgi:hypothetical protein
MQSAAKTWRGASTPALLGCSGAIFPMPQKETPGIAGR